ncbi:hypothetical protein MJG53_013034 [Ovis ammon polii x Ovis aries]|uniref:Uncharacterized protein n=2 Tax=Ovis TaxID=9935 RepID=A0A835ZR50_SHEEP|nr:hypothetical protein JEQ12_008101 [Ovis aries]KAI4573196.1 hypothetical protein MJG53_013034 [Ovis ammon polii x Ovis aries]
MSSGPPDTPCRSEGAGPRAAGAASPPPAEGRPGARLPADDVPALWFRRPGGRGALRRLGRAESCAASNTSFPRQGRVSGPENKEHGIVPRTWEPGAQAAAVMDCYLRRGEY